MSEIQSQQAWFAQLLQCLQCKHVGLHIEPDSVRCPRCSANWPVAGGIPMLGGLPPNPEDRHSTIESAVRNFYEENPFPTYDDFDNAGSLVDKARRSVYGELLDEAIPFGARVLECGCGTGQLSTFLSFATRRCLGVDMCMASLNCGQKFREKQGLDVSFVQANLFNLPIAENSFDVVISKGVLHHTPDARKAFHEIVKRVKPGGHVIVGLYNYYGRIPTWLRKQLFRVLGRNAFGGDYVMRQVIKSEEKRRIWVEDQYNNPHETWHSVDEVLRWFKEEGLEYVNAYPKITFAREGETSANGLLNRTDAGSSLEHVLTQLEWIFTISREGALFDMFARKPLQARSPRPKAGAGTNRTTSDAA